MKRAGRRILLTSGETSGDHHAARLVREIMRMAPDSAVTALGGGELERAGADVRFRIDKYAFMGFSEVARGLPRILSLERKLERLLGGGEIDLYIPVDYPGFNLRLARYARKVGVPVLYYISPQVWAWGSWRIKRMRKMIDLMAVILPFEEAIYREVGIPVIFAGHPSLEDIEAPPEPKTPPDEGGVCSILLFPGSRSQEVERMLPVMLDAARMIKKEWPEARFSIGLAPLIDENTVSIPGDLRSSFDITAEGLNKLSESHLVIAASGTVTLQSAISGTPTVVIYKTSPITFTIGKRLVNIPHIAMPNVLAGREMIPELLQGDASAEKIASEAIGLLWDREEYRRMSADLIGLRESLRRDGGTALVAEAAIRLADGEGAQSVASALGREDRQS